MLADQRGGLRVVASSSERAHLLELFELMNEQGPCLDCFRTGTRVLAADLGDEGGRWPLFTAEALAADFRSAHSLPLRFRSQVIGALNLFRPQPGLLDNLDEAFDLLRTHARSHNLRLHDVATAVISSLLTVEELASRPKLRPSPDES
jgi:hypothetical protein